MGSFFIGFFVILGIAVYFARESSRRSSEQAALFAQTEDAPPPIILTDPLLKTKKSRLNLQPGWYPDAAGENETYFDGAEWTDSRPLEQA